MARIQDHDLAGAIVQCSFTGGVASLMKLGVIPNIKVVPFVIYNVVKQVMGCSPYYIPIAAPKGGFGVLCEEGTHASMFELKGPLGERLLLNG